MSTNPRCESKDLVGYRTKLETDVVLLHLLHHIGMPSQGKPVPDTFGTQ
jgi:hypothetical protein